MKKVKFSMPWIKGPQWACSIERYIRGLFGYKVGRPLKSQYTIRSIDQLKNDYGFSYPNEMVDAMSDEMCKEIDKEILSTTINKGAQR